MKKYWAVMKHCFRIQLVYRAEVALNAFEIVSRMLFAWLFWEMVFAGRETVEGFTMPAMLSYYVLSSFLASVDISGGVSGEISARIRDGTFSRFMVIPTDILAHFVAQNMGTSAFYSLFTGIVAGLCALVFRIPVFFGAEPAAVLCAAGLILLGLIFMVCFHFFIGILAFKFQDIGFFLRVQGAVLEFITGGVIPLVFLPFGVMRALTFAPFTHVIYTPVMLIMGRAPLRDGLLGLAVLASWTAGMTVINRITYRRLRIKYDGVGI